MLTFKTQLWSGADLISEHVSPCNVKLTVPLNIIDNNSGKILVGYTLEPVLEDLPSEIRDD